MKDVGIQDRIPPTCIMIKSISPRRRITTLLQQEILFKLPWRFYNLSLVPQAIVNLKDFIRLMVSVIAASAIHHFNRSFESSHDSHVSKVHPDVWVRTNNCITRCGKTNILRICYSFSFYFGISTWRYQQNYIKIYICIQNIFNCMYCIV